MVKWGNFSFCFIYIVPIHPKNHLNTSNTLCPLPNLLRSVRVIHLDRPEVQALDERLGSGDLVAIVHVDQQRNVEVAVADVADDRGDQPGLRDVGGGRGNTLGQP